jgi:hypothetical protein
MAPKPGRAEVEMAAGSPDVDLGLEGVVLVELADPLKATA